VEQKTIDKKLIKNKETPDKKKWIYNTKPKTIKKAFKATKRGQGL
jgi:hypothetical protein